MEVSHSAAAETTIQYPTPNVKTELIDYELPPILPKMENIPLFEETFTAHEETFEEKFFAKTDDESKVDPKIEDVHTEVDSVEFTEKSDAIRKESTSENLPKEGIEDQQKESTEDLPKESVEDQPANVDEKAKTDDVENTDVEMKNESNESSNLPTTN